MSKRVHGGHIIMALAERFDWFQSTMMTEFDIDGGRADLVFITKSRQLTEIEIKVSRADWNADALKDKWKRERPHISRFYYAVPGHLAENIPSWVPTTCGIIAIYLNKWSVPYSREIRPAKRKRAEKISDKTLARLHEAAYFRFWRREINLLRERYYRPAQVEAEAA